MKLLLDTHVWLWLQTEPERLDRTVLARCADRSNQVLLSAASAWEIVIKFTLGKLSLPEPPRSYIPSRMTRSGVEALNVTHAHAAGVSDLPLHHRDPFDRLLISQARQESADVVTVDPAFAAYDVSLIHATLPP